MFGIATLLDEFAGIILQFISLLVEIIVLCVPDGVTDTRRVDPPPHSHRIHHETAQAQDQVIHRRNQELA